MLDLNEGTWEGVQKRGDEECECVVAGGVVRQKRQGKCGPLGVFLEYLAHSLGVCLLKLRIVVSTVCIAATNVIGIPS